MDNQNDRSQQAYSNSTDGYQVAQAVEEVPSKQAKLSSSSCAINGAVGVVQILDNNLNRIAMLIYNDTAKNLYLSYGEDAGNLSIVAGSRSFSEKVAAGGKTTGPGVKYLGKVFATLDGAAAADEAIRVTEFSS